MKLGKFAGIPALAPVSRKAGSLATTNETYLENSGKMELLDSNKFTSVVADLLRQNKIPGLSIAVVHNNEIASRGYGVASYEDNIPCTGDTLFDIASSSKSLTAASVALLVDDKKHPEVQYEALMSDLLPDDFVMQEKMYTDSITVEDVLSHRTGMARHDSSCMGPSAIHPDNAKSITRNLRNLKVAAPVRSRYLYCNHMFTVASHLVEEVSKQSFSDFLDERIFAPLNMKSTTLQPSSAHSKGWRNRMAKGYIWEDNGWRGLDPQDCPEGQGAGSIISSANDFIKWVKALLYHEEPITNRVYQGLTKMRSIVNPNSRRLKAHTTPANYTAGMEVYFYRENMVIGHDGNIPGFSSRFIFMPDRKFGAVVMGNSTGAGSAATTIMRMLMDEVLEILFEDRLLQMAIGPKQKEPRKPLMNQIKPKHQKDLLPKDERLGQFKEQSESQSIQQNHTTKMRQNSKDIKKEKDKATPRRFRQKEGEKLKNDSKSSPQGISLEAYVGSYWNAGYHTLTVLIQDGQLFIDATDRSMGFTMTFEHFKDQAECIANLKDNVELTDSPVNAKFVFGADKALMMGLDLEPVIKEMIWFRRCSDAFE
ncbi:exo-beta-1-3-glucanase [Penicillium atrosanguineum]|uniref:exo-beta-1-3-glucanase n=1 Tax=Penicillium atrosanguineum TaxID=1132637 RepID=UPI002390B8E3|nr:exo-beta-1-3-glucanase [Penicillium atrosanguineum]KAJ5313227.1 exo-beta-1-3-glucanase [Penicillium atrosanguineum]